MTSMSDKVTVEKIATQYGLDTTYGAYAWRTVLQSPLDSERCRLLISKIAKPDVVPHRVRQATEQEPKVFPPPVAAGTDVSRTRDPPEPVIADFFAHYSGALTGALISHITAPHAWAALARPLLTLVKECSYLPAWAAHVRDDAQGKRLPLVLLRALVQMIGRGAWARALGVDPEEAFDEEDRYSLLKHGKEDATAALLVLPSLVELLPIVLNTFRALAEAEAVPAQNAKAAAYMRAQVDANLEVIKEVVQVEGPGLCWDEQGGGTETGDRLAWIYEGLQAAKEGIRP